MNYIIRLSCVIFFTFLASDIFAQEEDLLPNKQGVFKVVDWGVHRASGSDFTKIETAANYKKLVALTEIIHKNPVMNSPMGFECRATLYSSSYDRRDCFGIPCDLSFQFCYFYKNQKTGKELTATIEPPSWKIKVNMLPKFNSDMFSLSTPKPVGEQTKPGFNYERWNKVGEKLHNIYNIPKKETIARGIDRYEKETVVIYNPDRPPFWMPITIRELFTLALDYYKLHWDQAQSDVWVNLIEADYNMFSEKERDMHAYRSTIQGIARGSFGYCTDSTQSQVVRLNPEYWNKKLPRSAIQIISFSLLDDKNFYGNRYIKKFLEALDIKSLSPIID